MMLEEKLRLESHEGVYILRLSGDFDADEDLELREVLDRLVDTRDGYILLDLTEAGVLAPRITAELIRCGRKLSMQGGKLRAYAVPAQAREYLDLLNTAGNVIIFEDLTGALLSFPKNVRRRLGVYERRKGDDRRILTLSDLRQNRRNGDRRRSEPDFDIPHREVPDTSTTPES